jgi:hypothetical protein
VNNTTTENTLTSAALLALLTIATRSGWGRLVREILHRADSEPLAGIFGWALVGCGWALWMAARLPVPCPVGALCAFEGWAVTVLGGPLVALSETAKRRDQGAER